MTQLISTQNNAKAILDLCNMLTAWKRANEQAAIRLDKSINRKERRRRLRELRRKK